MNLKVNSDRAQGELIYHTHDETQDSPLYRLLDIFNRSNLFSVCIGFPTADYDRVRGGNLDTEYRISLATEDDTDCIMVTLTAHDEDEGEHDDVKFSMRFALEDLIQFFMDNPGVKADLEWKLRDRLR